jgi:hypothetical protein
MGKKRKTSTEQMLDAVARAEKESQEEREKERHPNFPHQFLIGLRGALDAGLSCEEITALLVLFSGIYEASAKVAGDALVERASLIAEVMSGDIDAESRRRIRIERSKEEKKRKRRNKWIGKASK